MRKQHKAQDGNFGIGTRIIDPLGLRWTRIAHRGQADWIADTGKLSQHLPAPQFVITVEHRAIVDEPKSAFPATPVLSADSIGFGIVAESDIIAGDTLFHPGFSFPIVENIVSVERKTLRKRGVEREVTVATDKRGITHVLNEANYVARNLGDRVDSYMA